MAAYPEHLASHDDQNLVWKDGTRQPLSDGQKNKTFDDLLNHPSIIDQFKIRYRLGQQTTLPSINEDPNCGGWPGCPIEAAEPSWRPASTALPRSSNKYPPSLRNSHRQ